MVVLEELSCKTSLLEELEPAAAPTVTATQEENCAAAAIFADAYVM
jgi:hypothetical protein